MSRERNPFPVPASFAQTFVRSTGPGRFPARRDRNSVCQIANTPSKWHRTTALLAGLLLLVFPGHCRAEVVTPAPAATSSGSSVVLSYAAFVTEASSRFAIPEPWIRAVMQVESRGNAHAISSRGAVGLMQIMPATWVELSVRYGLGIDPFDPHDNILAGTAYLRETLDRFGLEGFLAAYNAGPKRYEEQLNTARPLPGDTQAYVAELASLIKRVSSEPDRSVPRPAMKWQHGPGFVERSSSASGDDLSTSAAHLERSSNELSGRNDSALAAQAAGLFVRQLGKEPSK